MRVAFAQETEIREGRMKPIDLLENFFLLSPLVKQLTFFIFLSIQTVSIDMGGGETYKLWAMLFCKKKN